ELWSRAYDSEENVLAAGAVQTADSGLVVLATITHFPDPDDDLLLVKLDAEGDEVWSRTWEEGITTAHALVKAADGGYLIAGSTATPDGTADAKEDFLFIQVDADGHEMWRSTFGEPDMIDYGVALSRTADGGYIAVGERTADRVTWESDIMLVKIDASGRPLWQQVQPATHTMFSRILEHPEGGYMIAGAMFVDPRFNILLMRTDSLGNIPAPSSRLPGSTIAAQVSAAIKDLAVESGLSGVVLMAHDGEPLFTAAYGLAERELDIPNQIDTLFNLGSMDKMFTGVAILQLVEQGRLALDDTIAEVLPDYPNQEVARAVTIHHLLTHTSGMGDWFDSERYEELHDQLRAIEDYLPLLVDTPLAFEPGEHFLYSNSGYIVLGLIVARITGQSYYDYVRESIFEPAGMTHTAAYELDADVPNRAIGYTQVGPDGSETGEIADYFFAMPMRGSSAGGGFSTAGDLLRFANALLDHDLLNTQSTELLMEGKAPINDRAQYAYGFFDRMLEGQRVVGHSGGAPGICDYMDIYLDQGYTFIVLTNSDDDCLAVIEATREILLPAGN
ncbi:MAG: beta-lactamase family protein, partial [Anaerolineae bacterium]|nr:beta-lactamase family protein [Anaerolineae bacterium]